MASEAAAPTRLERVRVRRNVRWLAAGILAMALGGLGTWALFSTLSDTRPALKVTHTLYRGQVIQPSDLAVVAVGKNSDIVGVGGDQLNAVVGQRATTDLPGGMLLVPGSYGQADLNSGLARVGLKLDAGRITNTQLKPGSKVRVVFLAAQGQTGAPPASVDAVLAMAPTVAADGSTLVDLNVAAAQAEAVARGGAAKQVVLIQQAEG